MADTRRLRLAYFVHGRGRGHASRALSIVPALRDVGYEVQVLGSGDALPVLQPLGTVQARAVVKPGPGFALALWRRRAEEKPFLREARVDMVISDGDQGALLAAHALGLPSLAIGHDLVFSRCSLPAGLSRRDLLHQRANALIPTYLASRRVAVNFLPVHSKDPSTRVARPEIAAHTPNPTRPRNDRLVCYFRDDNAEQVLALARGVTGDIVSYGGSAAERASQPLLSRDAFRDLLSGARAVVGSAGSNLIAECVTFGVPMLALYRAGDAEQALNAQLLARAKLGMAACFTDVDAETLRVFWRRVAAQDFETLALPDALPSVVDSVLDATRELLSH